MTVHQLKENRILALSSLVSHEKNYRKHPEEQIEQLMGSLQRFGQARSIVVQERSDSYRLVAGHGIVEAARRLHYPSLRADILPSDWSDEQIKGYLIADNQHMVNAVDDKVMLAQLLQEQQDFAYDFAALGVDEGEYLNLVAFLEQEQTRQLPFFTKDAPKLFPLEEEQTTDEKNIQKIFSEDELYEEKREEIPLPIFPPKMLTPVLPGATLASFHSPRGHIEEDPDPQRAAYVGIGQERYLEMYQKTSVRQIVLVMNNQEYGWFLEKMGSIRKLHHLDTNTDVVRFLLENYEEKTN